jgi:hypothetical protein
MRLLLAIPAMVLAAFIAYWATYGMAWMAALR